MSQGEFAALAGLTERAQRKYEKNERHPDTKYMLAVAAGGADVVYILTGTRTVTVGALNAEEAAMLYNYRAATDGGRAAARAVLDAVEKQPARPAKRAVGE